MEEMEEVSKRSRIGSNWSRCALGDASFKCSMWNVSSNSKRRAWHGQVCEVFFAEKVGVVRSDKPAKCHSKSAVSQWDQQDNVMELLCFMVKWLPRESRPPSWNSLPFPWLVNCIFRLLDHLKLSASQFRWKQFRPTMSTKLIILILRSYWIILDKLELNELLTWVIDKHQSKKCFDCYWIDTQKLNIRRKVQSKVKVVIVLEKS